MAGSNTNQWARLLKRNKFQWPEPEKSTGKYYRKMGRDASCWEAVDTARETFKSIAAEVKTYLDKNSDPVPQTVTWSIYMIGRTKETAKPIIMFCCKDSRCRKRVRRTIEESGILGNYPGVRVGDCSLAPDFDQLIQLAANSRLDLKGEDVYYDPSKKEFGAQLYLKGSSSNIASVRKTTGGGVVQIGNEYFYLTVAHAFTGRFESSPRDEPDCDFEFDIDQSDPEDENDFVESTSKGSVSPELYASSDDATASLEPPADLTSNPQEVPDQESGESDTKGVINTVDNPLNSNSVEFYLQDTSLEVIGQLAGLSTDGSRPDLDYALIKIRQQRLHTYNRIALANTLADRPEPTFLYPERVSRIKPQNTSILTVTASTGLINGILSGTPTFMKSPSSNTYQEVWTVRLDGHLTNGDCGSWVVDSKNGDLLGHIVAGSPATGVAYIIPAYQIFEDLISRFGIELRLPLRDERIKEVEEVSALIPPKDHSPRAEEASSKTIKMESHVGEDSGWEDQPDSKSQASHHSRRREPRRKQKAAKPVASDADSHHPKKSHRPIENMTFKIMGDVQINGNFILNSDRRDDRRPLPSLSETSTRISSRPRKMRRSSDSATDSDEDAFGVFDDGVPQYAAPKQLTKLMTPSERPPLHSGRVQRQTVDEWYDTQTMQMNEQLVKRNGKERSVSSGIGGSLSSYPLPSSSTRTRKPIKLEFETDATSYRSNLFDENQEDNEGRQNRAEEDEDASDDDFSRLTIEICNPNAQDIPAIVEKAILDTGTAADWVSLRFYNERLRDIGVHLTELSKEDLKVQYRDFNGKEFQPAGKVELMIQTQEFKSLIKCRTIKFFIAGMANFSVLFGRNTIRKHEFFTNLGRAAGGEGLLVGIDGRLAEAKKAKMKGKGEDTDKITLGRKYVREARTERKAKGQDSAYTSDAYLTTTVLRRSKTRPPPKSIKESWRDSDSSLEGTW